MKKLSLVIVLALVLTGTAFSQAFQKGDKLLSIGVGAASYIHLGNNGYYSNYYYGGYYSRIAGVLTFQAEFGIHKYVGLGFSVGAGGTGGYGYWDPEIVAPATILANCHFYQIIADKTGKNIHADKLDIYAGLNVGSGIGFFPESESLYPLLVVGPQAGVRYYFKPGVAVHGEFGYGKTIFNAGFTFKPGAGKKKAEPTSK